MFLFFTSSRENEKTNKKREWKKRGKRRRRKIGTEGKKGKYQKEFMDAVSFDLNRASHFRA